MKSNKEIINMHMRGNFEQLSQSVQDAILSAMNESNSEACLNYSQSTEREPKQVQDWDEVIKSFIKEMKDNSMNIELPNLTKWLNKQNYSLPKQAVNVITDARLKEFFLNYKERISDGDLAMSENGFINSFKDLIALTYKEREPDGWIVKNDMWEDAFFCKKDKYILERHGVFELNQAKPVYFSPLPNKEQEAIVSERCDACKGHGWNGVVDTSSTCSICNGTGTSLPQSIAVPTRGE